MSCFPYIHLSVHTPYSLLHGAIRMENIPKLCDKYSFPAMAITDTMNLFGAIEFSQICCAHGIQPILGVTLCLEKNFFPELNEISSLVALACNEEGYENLMSLISCAHRNTSKEEVQAVVTAHLLRKYCQGLIILTAGFEGPIAKSYLKNNDSLAKNILEILLDIFGVNNLYIDLQRHFPRPLPYNAVEKQLIALAYSYQVGLVASNTCLFEEKEDYSAHDILVCMAEKTVFAAENRKKYTQDHFFKSSQDMEVLFEDIPEAIKNTVIIAKRCLYVPPLRAPLLPKIHENEDEMLKLLSCQGLEKRLALIHLEDDQRNIYEERLNYELKIIHSMHFSGYFLIVADFIQWAKNNHISVGPGRGSGAGSLVAWVLSITDLDPIHYGLLFERFLNPERISMPDFDIDFCPLGREKVLEYVRKKYDISADIPCVAQIITFGKLQARGALRGVGRVLQVPYAVVFRICSLIPQNPTHPMSLQEALDQIPEFRDVYENNLDIAPMIDFALKLEGLYSHASVHAAGVVIADRSLEKIVPLYKDPHDFHGLPVTQYSMKFVEKVGLVKFDFLGLKTLTVLDQTLDFIRKTSAIDLDLATVSLTDCATYEMLSLGKTMGVFQLEGSGVIQVLKHLKPDCIEDIIAVLALYRPGPMDNIPYYIARKQGKEKPDYFIDDLECVLKETYGIMIYQEQVMQVAQIMANYSLGAADLLRRAMGKKLPEEMKEQEERFIKGACQKGFSKDQAVVVFEQMEKFAGYGFNKSHAAAYAVIAYQTAYLKAHYPLEFIASLMNCDILNTDKLGEFAVTFRNEGILICAPHVNISGAYFSIDKPRNQIIYALGALKNVGLAFAENIETQRLTKGNYKNLSNFLSRILLNRRALESMIKSSALDTFGYCRVLLMKHMDSFLVFNQKIFHDQKSGQMDFLSSLFVSSDHEESDEKNFPFLVKKDIFDTSIHQALPFEKESIGFYLSTHPLLYYKPYWESLKEISSYEDVMKNFLHQTNQKLPGDSKQNISPDKQKIMVGYIKKIRFHTKKKTSSSKKNFDPSVSENFAILQCMDCTHDFDILLSSKTLLQYEKYLKEEEIFYFCVQLRENKQNIKNILENPKDRFTLFLESLMTFHDYVLSALKGLCILFKDLQELETLRYCLEKLQMEDISSLETRKKIDIYLASEDSVQDWVDIQESYVLTCHQILGLHKMYRMTFCFKE